MVACRKFVTWRKLTIFRDFFLKFKISHACKLCKCWSKERTLSRRMKVDVLSRTPSKFHKNRSFPLDSRAIRVSKGLNLGHTKRIQLIMNIKTRIALESKWKLRILWNFESERLRTSTFICLDNVRSLDQRLQSLHTCKTLYFRKKSRDIVNFRKVTIFYTLQRLQF